MKILCLGDVYAKSGVEAVGQFLRENRGNYDLIVVNAENAADGFGITSDIARFIFRSGADVITTGNHVWNQKDIYEYLDSESRILRPHNFPASNPGRGVVKLSVKGEEVLIVNMQGSVFMHQNLEPAFLVIEKLLEENNCKNVIVDFHAEATSEKMAFAKFLDGRASLVFGTHTHVQTNDAQILPAGTGYCTDIGMCGSQSGIIGVEREIIIKRFLTSLPSRFKPSEGEVYIHGISAVIEDGKCREISLVKERVK